MRGNWLCAAVLLGALTGQAGIQVGTYTQETRTFYTVADGLPDNDTLSVLTTEKGEIYAITAKGAAKFSKGKWVAVRSAPAAPPAAARDGLYVPDAKGIPQRVYPRDGARSWAPVEVRGVVHDAKGRLWFASPQGVGCRENGQWKLYTPTDGLPYDDFTAVAAGGDGAVWFGTRRGAIRFDGKTWEYRQGLRWLPDDEVRSIAVANNGDAWFATGHPAGEGQVLRGRD
jgi:ligand-binding sensor domain-containing protein